MADVYDAATSKRCYSEAKLPVQVLHEMRTRCGGFFDPVVEEAFCRTVPPFPVGQTVELADGIAAVVQNLAERASRLQSGYVYHYAFAMLIGVAGIVTLYLVVAGG